MGFSSLGKINRVLRSAGTGHDPVDFEMNPPAFWTVYIIRCSDSTLYTGITRDIARRFRQHGNRQGAKYFRGRQPEALVYLETGHNQSTASRREIEIKKMSRIEKLQLIADAGQCGLKLSAH